MVDVKSFFHEDTSTLTHVVYDKKTKHAVIIDPVMDFNLQTFGTAETSVKQIVDYCKENHLQVSHVLETHIHADHLSGSQLVKKYFPQVKICIGEEVHLVQKYFSDLYDIDEKERPDESCFDLLYSNGKEITLNSFSIKTWHTPGHTPACYTLQIGDKLFTGDALFAPDVGTGRCDFPGGEAKTLYQSIKKHIYSQGESSTVFFGHDYPNKRPLMEHVSLKEELNANIRITSQTKEEDFIKFRRQRDKELAPPKLILPSLLVNIYGGRLPKPRKNGRVYFRLPLNAL